MLGVPAGAWDHWLMLFTGNSMVSIDDPDATDDHEGELVLASGLRALGEREPVVALPPPSSELRALVDEVCETD